MRSCLATGVLVTAAAFLFQIPGAATPPARDDSLRAGATVLDVPFVPQSEVLCGGAALAMVLRYWGESGVLAEEFAPLVESGAAGITTVALVQAVRARGWTALPVTADRALVQSHLARGRPVIALIQSAPGRFHYVVLVAWANGGVIVHDPAAGPYRARPEKDFEAAWNAAERWALLVLPPAAPSAPPPAPPGAPAAGGADSASTAGGADSASTVGDSTASSGNDDCDRLVADGLRQADAGDTVGAERSFRAAAAECPGSAAPLRELAGLRFAADDWAGAARLAERAAMLDPGDAHTWRLLGGSRFLAGDIAGALAAWNHLPEPEADVAQVEGLTHTRYRAVTEQLGLRPGRLITPQAFERAGRRLAELPALLDARLTLRPQADGRAAPHVALVERPLIFNGPADLIATGLRAVVESEVTLQLSSPTGNGELWSAGGRWWDKRPRVSLGLAAPAVGGRPGLWRVEGFWERQTYSAGRLASGVAPTDSGLTREERRRTELSFSDWLPGNLRLEICAGLDKWVERGHFISLETALETRRAQDRLTAELGVAGWNSVTGRAPFETGRLKLRWGPSSMRSTAWLLSAGLDGASSRAPLALWPGAGTGYGRPALLRAHPLLHDGVIDGRAFGRTLAHGNVEHRWWPWTYGPLRLGWALFVDTARPWATPDGRPVPWQVDGGIGLRLAGPGMRGQLRVDWAHGFEDGESALSVGWSGR